MVEAGMDVARLSFAHGAVEEHLVRLHQARAAIETCGRPVGVMADLPGPKVRTAAFGGPTLLQRGARVALFPGRHESSAECIGIDPPLFEDVRAGDELSLGDGMVRVRLDEVDATSARGVVTHGGRVQGRSGIRLPVGRLSASTPTDDDLQILAQALEAGVDMLAVSFVHLPDDVDRVRVAAGTAEPLVIAKIETRAAIEHLDGIIAAADGVMVARGDLGIEYPIEDVPHLQKQIIRSCVVAAKPVITATQMLESMTHAPIPTRAEASDVVNAIFDGTDALMLSGETAVGADPILTVGTMARIALRAEREADYLQWGNRMAQITGGGEITSAMTHAAWRAVLDADASALLCCTRSGATARSVASFRPPARLVALSPRPGTLRQLTLSWGTIPLPLPESLTTDEMIANAVAETRLAGYAATGDVVAVLAGAPAAYGSATDILRLVRVS